MTASKFSIDLVLVSLGMPVSGGVSPQVWCFLGPHKGIKHHFPPKNRHSEALRGHNQSLMWPPMASENSPDLTEAQLWLDSEGGGNSNVQV